MSGHSPSTDYQALNDLVVNCPEFPQLETLLGRFNLFDVLRFAEGEIRHSNVLAWLLQPSAPHGLGDAFLRRWLMRVIHKSGNPPCAAAEIESLEIVRVRVSREWNHIDILLVITLSTYRKWVVCIENKVNSTQSPEQLKRYREVVEAAFPEAERRLFIFLTKNNETPDDLAYLSATYDQVHRALTEAIGSRSGNIGPEPRVLLDNYLRILEERFMTKSDVTKLALKIYNQHKRAIDIIVENHPDTVREKVREEFDARLRAHADTLDIVVEAYKEQTIRFIPKAWDVPQNQGFRNWWGNNRHVLCQVKLFEDEVAFDVASGKSPQSWRDRVYARAASAPFRDPVIWDQDGEWVGLHQVPMSAFSLADENLGDPIEMADAAFTRFKEIYTSDEMKNVIEILRQELIADPVNPA